MKDHSVQDVTAHESFRCRNIHFTSCFQACIFFFFLDLSSGLYQGPVDMTLIFNTHTHKERKFNCRREKQGELREERGESTWKVDLVLTACHNHKWWQLKHGRCSNLVPRFWKWSLAISHKLGSEEPRKLLPELAELIKPTNSMKEVSFLTHLAEWKKTHIKELTFFKKFFFIYLYTLCHIQTNHLLQSCSLVSLLVCPAFLLLSLVKNWLLLLPVPLWPLFMPNNARMTFSTSTRLKPFFLYHIIIITHCICHHSKTHDPLLLRWSSIICYFRKAFVINISYSTLYNINKHWSLQLWPTKQNLFDYCYYHYYYYCGWSYLLTS